VPLRCSCNRRAKYNTWSIISPAVRFLSNPCQPVAQNGHPTAQPTWVETQTVKRFFFIGRIKFHQRCSTVFPSSKLKSTFTVPSLAFTSCNGVKVWRDTFSPAFWRKSKASRSFLPRKRPTADIPTPATALRVCRFPQRGHQFRHLFDSQIDNKDRHNVIIL